MGLAERPNAREIEQTRRMILWDLFAFCEQVLGYDKLSRVFHGPMLANWDRVDRLRLLTGRQIDMGDLWPRDHIKTWCERARIIRAYAVRPDLTVVWWHAVEEMAQESAVAVGKQLQENARLRPFFPPGVLPSPSAKKFVTASGFSLRSNRSGDAPSMRAWGAGSEATGGHSNWGVLDDPVGYNDTVDSQHPAKIRWYQATARNVVRSDGWVDVIGTRWDEGDLYNHLMKPEHRFIWTVRGALERDGKPDESGEPTYLTRDQIERKRVALGPVMFPLQMQNDASHAAEAPWKPADCEHRITLESASGPGFKVCIMDPAARGVGGEDWMKEKSRGDGSKDRWAIQVWKFRRHEMRRERIWLDGDSSEVWSTEQGMARACQMMKKWGVRHVAIEDHSPYHYMNAFCRVAKDQGVPSPSYFDPGARFSNLILLAGRAQGKNPRFGAFVGKAQTGEIMICDTVPDDQVERFLNQVRHWVPRGNSNGLPFDDEADCATYSMDPSLESFVPRGAPDKAPDTLPPEFRPVNPVFNRGGRHIRFQ